MEPFDHPASIDGDVRSRVGNMMWVYCDNACGCMGYKQVYNSGLRIVYASICDSPCINWLGTNIPFPLSTAIAEGHDHMQASFL